MRAVLLAVAVTAAAALPAFANECDSEARSVENQLRSSGNTDLTVANRINRAQTMCRDSPVAGRSEMDSIRRELDQQASRVDPLRPQPPPLGEPWTGAGPGAAVNR